jgi:hypothetical protein
MSKNIIAGPWLGEFGWELMRWQGVFRKLAYDGWNVYMIARDGHQELYKDYVKEFIPAESLGFNTKGETDGWRINNEVPSLTMDQKNAICSSAKYVSAAVCMQMSKQEFIKYGEDSFCLRYPIIIHARATQKGGTDIRNWPREKWEELVARLVKIGTFPIACIGSKEGAMCFDNCIDKRGENLINTVDILQCCNLVIGPSSGPMHLASLCGTPHLVWTDDKFWGSCNGTNRQRYETNWNPLGTKTIILDEDNWQPSVDTVEKAIKDFFNGQDK